MKKLLLLCLLFSILQAFASDLGDFVRTARYTTPDVVSDSFNRDFYETEPPAAQPRSIAEFEPMKSVIIRYPLGIPMDLVVEMSQIIEVITLHSGSSASIEAQYESAGVNMENCVFETISTDSYWCRDYSPWFIFDGNADYGLVNFIYNRPRPNDNDVPIEYSNTFDVPLYGMPLEQTGGNYMSDGMGKAVSTEIAFDENTSLSEAQVRQHMEDYLGITDYSVIDDPQGDYIKHVDCWAKYLDVDKILIAQIPESNPQYDEYEAVADYFETKISSYGTAYEVYRVQSLANDNQPTPYTNSLILNDHVFVPITGTSYDDDAIAVYEEAMPGYTIVPIMNDDWNIGWINTDALHCRTHEVPDDEMIYIYHLPVISEEGQNSYTISATITPHSGEALVADQVYVAYKVNDGEFQQVLMTATENNNYEAELSNLQSNDVVSYYIHAEDNAGKIANHPFIGEADPHQFTVISDFTAPTINHNLITTLDITYLPTTLTAEVIDDNDINSVVLEYNINSELNTENFVIGEENVWTLDWNPTINATDNLEYRIVATNSAGLTTTIPETGFQTIDINETNNQIIETQDMILTSYPNPFNPKTTIHYYLVEAQNITLSIYNAKGQRIKELENESKTTGSHEVSWDGKDNQNQAVSSGIYFVRLRGKSFSKTHKIMLMK